MRNLYFKIFMWFWLAMALVGTAFVVSTVTIQRQADDARWRAFVAAGLELSGQSAIDTHRRHGQIGLASFFERLEARTQLRGFLFDSALEEMSGRELPEGGSELASRAADSAELEVREIDGGRLVARGVSTAEGDRYVILAEMDEDFRGGPRRGDQAGGRFGGASAGRLGGDRGGAAAEGLGRLGARGPPGSRGPGRGGVGLRTRRLWYSLWLSLADQPGELAFRLIAVFLTAGVVCYGLARYLTAPVLSLREATHRLAGGDLSVRVGPAVGNRRDELAELGRDFDRMAERIESLLTTQRQLLSDVSHELRSPLARLNVALALARRRSGPEAEGPLDRIETEAEQLNVLIGQVLSLARLESGAGESDETLVDLGRLIEDVASDADFEANAKGCAVEFSVLQPCRVSGTESLLRSAVENVVRNAVRYTAEGSNVEIEMSCPNDEAVIVVRDQGPGVPDDQIAALFQPFYRIADARDRESGGTGLGLAIAERAVRLHGGSVRALNRSGGGLLIEIRLPLKRRP